MKSLPNLPKARSDSTDIMSIYETLATSGVAKDFKLSCYPDEEALTSNQGYLDVAVPKVEWERTVDGLWIYSRASDKIYDYLEDC